MTRPMWIIRNATFIRSLCEDACSYMVGHCMSGLTIAPKLSHDTIDLSGDYYSMKLTPPMAPEEVAKQPRTGELRQLPLQPERYETDFSVPPSKRLFWKSIGSFKYLESGDQKLQVAFGPSPSLQAQLEVYDRIEELPHIIQPDLLSEFQRRSIRAMKTATPDICAVRTCIEFDEELKSTSGLFRTQ